MRRIMIRAAMALLLAVGAGPGLAAETYDLIFRTGTLDDVPKDSTLAYDRTVTIAADPDYAGRNTGAVRLKFAPDDMAELRFTQGERGRKLGAFPATVGNPIIMYFVETVLRDVAAQAGGSPFYIRNRIKEALVQPSEIAAISVPFGGGDIAARQITLRPFADDKNRDRMKGYGDLELTFTMSDDVPGWYRLLEARAVAPDGTAIYRNALDLRAPTP